ncbi:TPA: helix-turn-helix transcriptional regulator [Streptococcus equi subsp. zooepidemicus]|nr:helix-turn-helix transcriptional regulator [Streptococcus equi subsp. zooepidemicus]HEL1236040.1 helix-turn-helix transcriptional regulator [Streptococcus equi subsp. zooepidemicus]
MSSLSRKHEQIHHQRKLAKPSQSQLAELLRTNQQTLGMTENGKRRATIKKLVKLRNILV